MIAIAKVAIVQLRYNRFKGSGIHCALMLYKSKLKARLVTEFSYAMLTNQTDKFRRIWNCNNSLFTMKSNDLIFKFLNRLIRLYILFNFNYMSFVHYHVIIITHVNSCILIVYILMCNV